MDIMKKELKDRLGKTTGKKIWIVIIIGIIIFMRDYNDNKK